jgi:hypothetical protein
MFVSTLIFIFYIFLITMFIVYFGYISSIVSLLLSSCKCSYSAHPNMQDPWVGGRHYISVVLRYCLSANAPYTPGCVVDRGSDRPVKSYVVHPPCVGLVEPSLEAGETIFPILPSWCSLCVDAIVTLTMITRCNCTNWSFHWLVVIEWLRNYSSNILIGLMLLP